MEAFLTSTALVALAEIGDKTQLLSFVLAARLRKPWAIIAGIFAATVLNHALAGSVGVWVAEFIPASWLPWIIGIVFIAFGLWTLKPDTLDDDEAPSEVHPAGAFVQDTTGLPAPTPEAARHMARCIALSLDPCVAVGITLDTHHHA